MSILLRLPPELRNIIYAYVLRSEKFEIPYGLLRERKGTDKHPLALLLSCSQINKETAMLPYILSTFNMSGVPGDSGYWNLYDHIGPKQVQAIKKMRLTTYMGSILLDQETDLACYTGLEVIEIRDERSWYFQDLVRRIRIVLPDVIIQ
jgi:hypothetical protein